MLDRPEYKLIFLETLRKKLSNYLIDYKMTSRDHNDYLEFTPICPTNSPSQLEFLMSYETFSDGEIRTTINLSFKFSYELFSKTFTINSVSAEESLNTILALLSKKNVINPRLESFFQVGFRFKDHFSIFVLNKPKVSFSWMINDVLFTLENKKIDIFGKNDLKFLSVESMNLEKVSKDTVKASKDFEGLFSNETLKFVHFMDLTESPYDSENDYLNMMIKSKNKAEKYTSLNLKDSKVFRPINASKLLQSFLSNVLSANSNLSGERTKEFARNVEYELIQVSLPEHEWSLDDH